MTTLDIALTAALAVVAVFATIRDGIQRRTIQAMTDKEIALNDALNRAQAATAAIQAKLDAAGTPITVPGPPTEADIDAAVDVRLDPMLTKAEGVATTLEAMAGTSAPGPAPAQ